MQDDLERITDWEDEGGAVHPDSSVAPKTT